MRGFLAGSTEADERGKESWEHRRGLCSQEEGSAFDKNNSEASGQEG